jgi:hypothetical protein
MSTGRKILAVIGLAAVAILIQGGWASAAIVTWTDNFDSYANGSYLNGQGGWTDTSGGNNYRFVAAGGVGGTQGVNEGGGSQQMNWTAHPWDWATSLAVGDKVIARMDFQASGGAFDDDRVGWVLASNPGSSSYHFGVQLDDADGGLVTYLRNSSGGNVKNIVIATALLPRSGNNWYREEMQVTKLTSGLGANGARIDVSYSALDSGGNVVGTPVTGNILLDTSAWRGFSGQVYPMYKNYSALVGNADNAYFQITPEPATLSLLAIGGLLALRRRHR